MTAEVQRGADMHALRVAGDRILFTMCKVIQTMPADDVPSSGLARIPAQFEVDS